MIIQSAKSRKIQSIWYDMNHRCFDQNNLNYGGKGVAVCERWSNPTPIRLFTKGRLSKTGFVNFYEDMHESWFLGATIDRIDSDGDYCPQNCQWLTRSQNSSKVVHTQEMREKVKRKLTGIKRSNETKRMIGEKMIGNNHGTVNRGTVPVYDTITKTRLRVATEEFYYHRGIRYISTNSRKFKEITNAN